MTTWEDLARQVSDEIECYCVDTVADPSPCARCNALGLLAYAPAPLDSPAPLGDERSLREILADEVGKLDGKHPVEGGYCAVKAALSAMSRISARARGMEIDDAMVERACEAWNAAASPQDDQIEWYPYSRGLMRAALIAALKTKSEPPHE